MENSPNMTMSLREAADISKISYDRLLAASKLPIEDPRRPPGFRQGNRYRVLVAKFDEYVSVTLPVFGL